MSALEEDALLKHFVANHAPEGVTAHFGVHGCMAVRSGPAVPSPCKLSATNGFYCIFKGYVSNLVELKRSYSHPKSYDESSVIIESFMKVRENKKSSPISIDFLQGKFFFLVYDSMKKRVYIRVDGEALFWGVDLDESLIVSSNLEIVKRVCGNRPSPFPEGCYFTSSDGEDGLRSYVQPEKRLQRQAWREAPGAEQFVAFSI